MLEIAAACFAGYIIGSIPTAMWMAKGIYGIDITQVGSRNPGMTNVLRVLGWKPAVPVALVDTAKGWLACYAAFALAASRETALAAGIFAVLGHSFSFFAGFRGGKSVLAALGVFLFFAPLSCLSALFLWTLVTGASRYVSLGSIVSALALPGMIYLENRLEPERGLEAVFWAAAAVALFVVVRHKANIARLLQGKENKIGRRAG